jgi:hypothetical protein
LGRLEAGQLPREGGMLVRRVVRLPGRDEGARAGEPALELRFDEARIRPALSDRTHWA